MNPTPARAATSRRVSVSCVYSHDSAPMTGARTGAGGSDFRAATAHNATPTASAQTLLRSLRFLGEALDAAAAQHRCERRRRLVVGLRDLLNHFEQLVERDPSGL